jgi:hypothetical protein
MPDPPAGYNIAEALTPFSVIEVHRLRRYVRHAEELRVSRYFEDAKKDTVVMFAPGRVDFDVPENAADEEKLAAMLIRLRKLHAPGRASEASFPRIVKMLRSHAQAKGNWHSEWFLQVIEHEEEGIRLILSTSFLKLVGELKDVEGNVLSRELVTPEQAFTDWLYGKYLHDDEDKLERVEYWLPVPIHRFTFLQTAAKLARAYYAFTGIVREVLDEATLAPSGESLKLSTRWGQPFLPTAQRDGDLIGGSSKASRMAGERLESARSVLERSYVGVSLVGADRLYATSSDHGEEDDFQTPVRPSRPRFDPGRRVCSGLGTVSKRLTRANPNPADLRALSANPWWIVGVPPPGIEPGRAV